MRGQKIYLEHANITVRDLNRTISFFKTAFPHFIIRGRGKETREWIHLGDDSTYLAINQGDPTHATRDKDYSRLGINHLGFVVEDLNSTAKRLKAAGYQRSFPKQIEKYRVRDYFFDPDGNEIEFVEYLSNKLEEKNSYKAADSAQ